MSRAEGVDIWMGLRDMKKNERWPELRMDQLWNVKESGSGEGNLLRSLLGEGCLPLLKRT